MKIRLVILALVGIWLSVAGISRAAVRITDAYLDLNRIHKWDDCNGDTWDPFLADDDNLYAFNCDGRGFGSKPRNLAFNRLAGDQPDALVGAMINTMDEYGVGEQKGPDGATWKALGQECIDSVFYCFVSRQTYGSDSKDLLIRQTAANASLIKSTDHGITWSRSAAENYAHPMWPGRRFGAPYFIHYGKNGGSVGQDGADHFVYAISNNGFWNDGDDVILARIDRKKLPNLDPLDWTWFTGGDGGNDSSWSSKISDARPIFSSPAKCGTTSPCYVPALGVYVMVVWYNPQILSGWFNPSRMNYDFYQAERPWGPWTFISSCSDQFIVGNSHWYGPTLCPKFQRTIDGGAEICLFNAGCPFDDVPASIYKAWEIPLVLKTTPAMARALVNDDDPRIRYTGNWTNSKGRPFSDYSGDVHFTTTPGDAAEFTFTGNGVEYLTEKYHDEGKVNVYLDGKFAETVNPNMQNFPRLCQITVYRSPTLADGVHTLRIVNMSGHYALVDAFRVLERR